MRSMDSILASEPGLHSMPEGPESEAGGEMPQAGEQVGDGGQQPQQGAETAPEAGESENADLEAYDPEQARRAARAAREERKAAEKKAKELEEKNRQYEARLDALERQHRQGQQQTQGQDETDFLDDPQGAIERAKLESRFQVSEGLMQEQHEDYERAKQAFVRAAQQKNWLWQQAEQDALPARVIYREGKKILDGNTEGGGSERLTALERENAELKAQLEQARQPTAQTPAPNLPRPSKAGARGTGVAPVQQWQGPRPMSQILG